MSTGATVGFRVGVRVGVGVGFGFGVGPLVGPGVGGAVGWIVFFIVGSIVTLLIGDGVDCDVGLFVVTGIFVGKEEGNAKLGDEVVGGGYSTGTPGELHTSASQSHRFSQQ